MLDVFESWDLNAPPLPRRSLLLPVEPIGIGTPFVESLTSYIARLAEVHAVKVSDLVGYVLAACAPRDAPIVSERARSYRMGSGFRPGTHAINGLAEDARRWITAVETATDRTGLRLLTLRPLKQVFCKQSLFPGGTGVVPWLLRGLAAGRPPSLLAVVMASADGQYLCEAPASVG